MDKARIAIIGASGYTGAELVRLVATHPGMQVAALAADAATTSALIEMRRGVTYDDALADAALGRMGEPLPSPALGQRIARFFKERAKVEA